VYEAVDIQVTKASNNRWAILIITVMSTFMSTLDSSIVNVALPMMATSLNVTTGQISWVVSAYLIVISIFILFFGRLGDLMGQVKIFRLGLAIFTIGSFLCGVTHSFPLLIAARAVQAVGSAATMANSQGIITRSFPANERGRALGINGTFVALGALVGPALGGFIISFAGWEYLFWINVPIGFAVLAVSYKLFSGDEPTKNEKIDYGGTALFILAILAFFYALEDGQAVGFSSPIILICFLVSIVSFILFIRVEKKSESPLLDLEIFSTVTPGQLPTY
jgi:EmrB/QacA subfamily drug resistance transporter